MPADGTSDLLTPEEEATPAARTYPCSSNLVLLMIYASAIHCTRYRLINATHLEVGDELTTRVLAYQFNVLVRKHMSSRLVNTMSWLGNTSPLGY